MEEEIGPRGLMDIEIDYEIKDGFVLVPEEEYRISKLIEKAQSEVTKLKEEDVHKKWGDDRDIPKELSCRIFSGEENALKLIRAHRGISQGDLAKKAGVSKTMISHMENGRKQASARTIKKLACALNVDMEDLV